MSAGIAASPLMSSARETWCTPRVVLDALAPLGRIALDPCSNPHSIVGARRSLSLETGDDGLAESWGRADGLVYVNPPFGRAAPAWVGKAIAEAYRGTEIVMLLPARTDTRWWCDLAGSAQAIAFWRGRLTFLGAPAPAPFPTALVYWGGRTRTFVDAMRPRSAMVHVAESA